MFASRNSRGAYPPFLPDDVLRQVFEIAAKLDGRTAFNLSLLSRNIHPWIDEIMYSEVNLRSHRTARAFLRTIQTPDSKPPDFFANCVKSLSVYSDIETEHLLALLSLCRGVVNLSYWPSPAYATNASVQPRHTKNGNHHLKLNTVTVTSQQKAGPWDSHTDNPSPNLAPSPLFLRQATRIQVRAVTQSFELHNVRHVSPRRLSVLLQESHPLFAFRPYFFGVSFFSELTHLSIVNRWEDWTAWAGSRIYTDALPRLTHLKFDLVVGQAPAERPRSASPSCSRWLETVTDTTCASSPTDSERTITPAESAWSWKITQVANAISDVLNGHASLRVCVLVLRFDSNPARTAKLISRHAAPKMVHWNASASAGLASLRDGMQSSKGVDVDSDRMDVDMACPADAPPKFDPRLVFAWEKESFRYNCAHSMHEKMIWKSSEAVANAQRYLSGYTMLNCDYLI